MNATRLEGHVAVYSCESSRLRCSRSTAGCMFETASAKHYVDEPCPKCGSVEGGKLEPGFYQVDLTSHWLTGGCGCESFQYQCAPRVERIPPAELRALGASGRAAHQCKHIKAVRQQAKLDLGVATDDELDELLSRLPKERTDGP